MRTNRRMTGFTLVEILIVVVILGILAAIVVPQFTSASTEAVKGALQSQLQTIESQVELYRVRNNGEYPQLGVWDENGGWDDSDTVGMISEKYLKEPPFNGYTRSSSVASGDESDALGDTRASGTGWYFDLVDDSDTYGFVFASAYNKSANLVAHEDGFDD